jgi:RNA polymerase sigma-70 factor (ECF subfamily)
MAALSGEPEKARVAMSEVCTRYWQPVRKFLRYLGAGEQDAEDLAQEFFSKWATPENMARLDPARGRLRSYLKQSLRHYFVNAWQRRERLKRGGGVEFVELESAANVSVAPDAADALYDREWAAAVLAAVFDRLRGSYDGRGKARLFDLLSRYLLVCPKLKSNSISTACVAVSAKCCVRRWRPPLPNRTISKTNCATCSM